MTLAKSVVLRVQRVAFPGPSQSGRVVATFRLRAKWGQIEVKSWEPEAGDSRVEFSSCQEAATYVRARIHAINSHDSARSYYARLLERSRWSND